MKRSDSRLQTMLTPISTLRQEQDPEKRPRMFQKLNDSLPKEMRLQMPSLIINAYVRKALDMIEEILIRYQMHVVR
jgi:hypothetical protein